MQISKKISFTNYLVAIIVIYILVNMIISPSFYLKTTLDGISAWAFNVLPAILPFIFFTKILSTTGIVEKFSNFFSKPIQFLFNTSSISSFVFFSSIISGYPVGAKIIDDLYKSKKITRTDACKMMSFCSTSGPMFIIGSVGAGMFCSATAGYIIFISHIVGALLNGILYKKIKLNELKDKVKYIEKESKNDFSSIVLDSSLSVISVGTIIAIFFIIITTFSPLLNLLPASLSALLSGIIEITKGCINISTISSLHIKIVLSTFVISFGGFSTLLQSFALTKSFKPPVHLLLLEKITHALLSLIIAILILTLFPI